MDSKDYFELNVYTYIKANWLQYAMSIEILNELPYGVVVCQENGNMLYVNQAASKIFNCPNGKLSNYNILTFIDPGFVSSIKTIIESPENAYNALQKNYTFIRLNSINSKIFKVVYKRYKSDILLTVYDYSEFKIDEDNLSDTFLQLNISISRSNLVLKTMSSICKDVFYKDRSNLQEIVELLAKTFNLYRASICFKNGTGHIIFSKLEKDGSYKSGTIESDKVRSNCFIWEKEDKYINDKELFFQVPCSQHCCVNELDSDDLKNRTLNILKLKLNTNKVIGYFEFVEGDSYKLSGTELEVLEGLSQILAYIINNKEQVEDVTKYIQQRFSNLVPHIK